MDELIVSFDEFCDHLYRLLLKESLFYAVFLFLFGLPSVFLVFRYTMANESMN